MGSHPTEEDQSSSSARGSDDVVYLSPCPTSPNCIAVQRSSFKFFFYKHFSQFKVPVFSDVYNNFIFQAMTVSSASVMKF